jgi:type II secretion system protein I
MCSSAREDRNSAFTLLEVLLALTIFSVAILAILSAVNISQRANSHAEKLQEAAALAQNQLELAVDRPADALSPKQGNDGLFAWSVEYAEKSQGLMMASAMVQWQERNEPQSFRVSQIFKPVK